jgi:hypothetical protein
MNLRRSASLQFCKGYKVDFEYVEKAFVSGVGCTYMGLMVLGRLRCIQPSL